MDLLANFRKWKYHVLATLASISAIAASYLALRKIIRRRSRKNLREVIYSLNPPSVLKLKVKDEKVIDQDIPFIVSVKLEEHKKPARNSQKTNPFLYPFEEGIHIRNIGQSYRLLFNKFPVVDKHVLIATYQFEKQEEPLTVKDFRVAWEVCKELRAFAFYNSGPASGYSQEHKHIQVIPWSSLPNFPLGKVIEENLSERPFAISCFHFKHFYHGIPKNPTYEHLHGIYKKLMNLLNPSHSYNLILTEKWMLLVPREKERSFNRFDLNAMAYMGFMLVKSNEELEFLKKIGPLALLRDAAINN
ncbi:unnamed protein product [Blepharisma stoltei]|uniref:ATP adenylyltransferase n=1 Tax=Blepharisma stoltei TaxID=1481888 RepID=A0AAU9K1N5_9CILI|nr:unnamed protein product [Blepharisma stoltei]